MTNKKCPDCGAELTQIKLFGRGWKNPVTGLAVDSDLAFYTGNDAEMGDFTGMYKPQGHVESYLCAGCGRIFLYGAAK